MLRSDNIILSPASVTLFIMMSFSEWHFWGIWDRFLLSLQISLDKTFVNEGFELCSLSAISRGSSRSNAKDIQLSPDHL